MESAVFLFLIVLFVVAVLRSGGTTKRKRTRKKPFKVRYDLDRRQPLAGFEEKLALAMFAEGKEVFVTAFCNDIEVLRVTATIGTVRRCGPSDLVENWGMKAQRLEATQVRQYHNHPDVWGRSFPSPQDYSSNKYLRSCVEPYGVRFHALLIYKTWFGTHAVKEYR